MSEESGEQASHLVKFEGGRPDQSFVIEINGDRQSVNEIISESFEYGQTHFKWYSEVVFHMEQLARDRDVELNFLNGESVVKLREDEAYTQYMRDEYPPYEPVDSTKYYNTDPIVSDSTWKAFYTLFSLVLLAVLVFTDRAIDPVMNAFFIIVLSIITIVCGYLWYDSRE